MTHDAFADDVLERLIQSNHRYQREHGHYIVPLSERLLAARAERDKAWKTLSDHQLAAERRVADLESVLSAARGYVAEPGSPGTVIETTEESAERSASLLATIDRLLGHTP